MYRTLFWGSSIVLIWGALGYSPGLKLAIKVATADEEPADLTADPHLVGWWRLDEVSGTSAGDQSKSGHEAVLKGGLAFDHDSKSGPRGRALEFDGQDDVVEVPGFKGVAGTHPRTVAVWIKTTSSRGEIVAWGTDDAGKMWILGFIRRHVGVTPSGGYLYINDEIDDGQWHHVAAVVRQGDPPNLYDSAALYVDGELAEIHDIGLLDVWPIDTGDQLDVRIGRRFTGLIDDVRLYDRALNDDEIRSLYRQK